MTASTDHAKLLKQLSAPFPPDDIEWRVQQAGITNDNAWAMVIPYITNRAIQQRLDDVFGLNWQNTQTATQDGKGYICGISVKIGDEWVTRYDGAEYTAIEPLKGALSGAQKRAGVQFGIGRYLYDLDEVFAKARVISSRRDIVDGENFAKVKVKGSADQFIAWSTPRLPDWAIPISNTQAILDKFEDCQTITALQGIFDYAMKYAKAHQDAELQQKSISAKDERKAVIDKQLTLRMKENFELVDFWLTQQCDSLTLITNEEAISAVSKTLKEELEKRCLHQKFDKSSLFKKLETQINNRIKQLGA